MVVACAFTNHRKDVISYLESFPSVKPLPGALLDASKQDYETFSIEQEYQISFDSQRMIGIDELITKTNKRFSA
jgi:hypothetical protein